jgi:hypothetical protein
MAIVQISQIQLRRGLQQDLPNLASAEMGWAVDTRRLFIGNGTLEEGAPSLGKTEILTEYSNFLGFISAYTFSGTDAGYTSQTGVSPLTPVTRSLQSVLDEHISIKDFGATGDGQTNDTVAINRAIAQIYPGTVNGIYPNVQRSIYFPAGNYKITGPIFIPPNITLIGEGKNNTIFSCTSGSVFVLVDSLFQIAADIGINGAQFPGHVHVSNMKLSTATGTSAVLTIDSATDVIFDNVDFTGPSTVINLISISASQLESSDITFDKCYFNGGQHGLNFLGFANAVRVVNSKFKNQTIDSISVNSYVTGLTSEGNFYDNVPTSIANLTGNNYSIGDTVSGTFGGASLGSARYGVGSTLILATGTNNLFTVANGAGTIDYSITTASGNRYGKFSYNILNGVVSFDDEYTEPYNSVGATMLLATTGVLTCTVTGSSTIKYNLKQFI